jgi:hypothetical protein
MGRPEGPGSESRLRQMQRRFRAARARSKRRSALRGAAPWLREFGVLFVVFLVFGALVWWLIA